jgi:hypothetical protein
MMDFISLGLLVTMGFYLDTLERMREYMIDQTLT